MNKFHVVWCHAPNSMVASSIDMIPPPQPSRIHPDNIIHKHVTRRIYAAAQHDTAVAAVVEMMLMMMIREY